MLLSSWTGSGAGLMDGVGLVYHLGFLALSVVAVVGLLALLGRRAEQADTVIEEKEL